MQLKETNAPPSVSILIPTYNYGRFLIQAIDSVLAQTVKPLEVVVADDGSTDDTEAVVARYGEAVKYRKFEHQGVFSVRQAMLAELRGDWFLNLDADDWIQPDFLEKALAVVSERAGDERLAFVYADRVDYGAYDRLIVAPEFDAQLFKRGNFVPMDSLIRTEVTRRFGFDAAFNGGWGDYDFFLTLAKNGYCGARLAGSPIHCRVHPASITEATAEADRKQRLMRQIVAKHSDFFAPEEAQLAIRLFSPEAVLRYRVCERVWAGQYTRAAGMLVKLLFTRPQVILSADVANRILERWVKRRTANGVGRISGKSWLAFERARRLMGRRKMSLPDKIRLGWTGVREPHAFRRAMSYAASSKGRAGRRIAVVSGSDIHGHLGEQLQWGDFWIKQELIAAIAANGDVPVEPWMYPDTVVHLAGGILDLPDAEEHVLWIHSHPEKLSKEWLCHYDRIYSISPKVCEWVKDLGLACEWLPMATGKRKVEVLAVQERVVFVGNALPMRGGHRKVVDDMLAVRSQMPQLDFEVWGGGFRDLPPGVLRGEYLPYHEVDGLYASSAITLNDHRPEMAREGLINPRILDVLASGGFVVSDRNEQVNALFGDAVPQYSTTDELAEIVCTFWGHPERRTPLMEKGRGIIREFTWARAAKKLMGRE